MRIRDRNRLLASVAAYFMAIGAVIVGAPYALQAALSSVEQPSFLVPEHLMASSVETARPESAPVEVLVKPWSPAVPNRTVWRPAIVRSYVTRAAETKSATPPKHTEQASKKKRKQKARHKRPSKPNPMDAYASGAAWR